MPNMLANAITWLDSTLKTSAGDVIVYQRGSSSVSITAPVGSTDGDRMGAGGSIYSFITTDFLIKQSDLVIDGEIVVPQRGDLIVWNSCRYTVLAQNSGEKPYSESGPGGTVLRVRTKKTGEAD